MGLGYEVMIVMSGALGMVHRLMIIATSHYLSNTPYIQVQPDSALQSNSALLPRMAILKPSRLRTRPDVNPIYVQRFRPNPQFDDRLNNFTSAILHSILRQ